MGEEMVEQHWLLAKLWGVGFANRADITLAIPADLVGSPRGDAVFAAVKQGIGTADFFPGQG